MLAVAEAPPAVVPRGSGGHNRLRSSLGREVENVRFSLRPQPSRTSARGPYGPSSPFVHPSHHKYNAHRPTAQKNEWPDPNMFD